MLNGSRVRRSMQASQDAVVRADGSYIITGGLGGLGMVVARWLVERGAGRLILNGRTEPSDDQRRDLADLANGAEIVFVAGDIASPGVAERLVAAAEETGRPLRGVVHAAGVTGDGIVAALTREGMERVWAPKVGRRIAAARSDGHPTSSTGGLASLRWLRCWVCRVNWRTQPPTHGSTPWWRGDAHRVCPQPRSTGASGRTSG